MEEIKNKILETMREAAKPLNASEVAKLSGIEKADVDKAFKEMKKEGSITSPVRCKWEPAE
ncbi:MAG: transcriptional regulator [Anaerofustis stercorihominis]|nr:transcriptional regulator [Anaerofustis stercorihominis]